MEETVDVRRDSDACADGRCNAGKVVRAAAIVSAATMCTRSRIRVFIVVSPPRCPELAAPIPLPAGGNVRQPAVGRGCSHHLPWCVRRLSTSVAPGRPVLFPARANTPRHWEGGSRRSGVGKGSGRYVQGRRIHPSGGLQTLTNRR